MRLARMAAVPAITALGGTGGVLLAGDHDEEGLALIVVATAAAVLAIGLREIDRLQARVIAEILGHDHRVCGKLNGVNGRLNGVARIELERNEILDRAINRSQRQEPGRRRSGSWSAPFN